MGLSSHTVSAQVAVSDTAIAREFYEGKLRLPGTAGPNEATWMYRCGAGTSLYVYTSPAHAGRATATVARWDVDDLEQVVDELITAGVTFEQYPQPVKTDARGIHDSGYGKVAWFRDPDGNTFALEQISPTE